MAEGTAANSPAKAATGTPEKAAEKAGDAGAADKAGVDEKADEQEECGFCKFMKAGSCETAFVAWEDCVDKAKEADGDFVEKCAKQTEALRECMLADPGYYGDMLPDEGEADDRDRKDDREPSNAEPPLKKNHQPSSPRRRGPEKQSRAASAVERA
jgi:hypothetical protein